MNYYKTIQHNYYLGKFKSNNKFTEENGRTEITEEEYNSLPDGDTYIDRTTPKYIYENGTATERIDDKYIAAVRRRDDMIAFDIRMIEYNNKVQIKLKDYAKKELEKDGIFEPED